MLGMVWALGLPSRTAGSGAPLLPAPRPPPPRPAPPGLAPAPPPAFLCFWIISVILCCPLSLARSWEAVGPEGEVGHRK